MILEIRMWGDCCRGKRIALWTDNQSCYLTVSRMRPHNDSMKDLCHEFLFWVCHYQIEVEAMWIDTKSNVVADFLSRTFTPSSVSEFFVENGLHGMKELRVNPSWLKLSHRW